MSRQEDSLRHLYSVLRDEAADDLTRARLRRSVMERLAAPVPARRAHAGWLTALAASAAAVVLAVLLVGRGGHPAQGEPTLSIQVNGGTLLRWTDVGKSSYRVLRSTRAADFGAASQQRVSGTSYVDHEPARAEVVYYRVE